jgi:hypothetical protein
MSSKRREFTRVTVPIECELHLPDRVLAASLRDVSMIGAFLPVDAGPTPAPAETKCRLLIFLDGKDGKSRIEADAHIVRADANGVAIEFEDLVGLDSYWHLRSLVVYNAQDPEAAEREVDEHVGIRRKS